MQWTFVAVALAAVCVQADLPMGKFELFEYNPKADDSIMVVSGNARFTVLTPRLIRMQYSSSGKFEDRATLAFLNRNVTRVPFQSSTTNGELTIQTSALTLTYTTGQAFSPSSLNIKAASGSSSAFTSWAYGDANPGNLLGTIKSLDVLGPETLNCTMNSNVSVHGEELHCAWGIISRDGWAVVDDTGNQALTEGNEWWGETATDDEDLYFFGHGHDYRGALKDFTDVAGKIAMIPRYGNGIWWTRWYDYGAEGIVELAEAYESRRIPMDTFVLDMDWHSKQGWGGYSFDERLFPEPTDVIANYLKAVKGLRFAVNLHDDDGVRSNENMYAALAKAIGFDTSTNATIPFSMLDKAYVYGLQDIVLGDVVKQGVDVWWSDWQQGGKEGGCTGGKQNPTIWIDKQRGTEHFRRGEPERAIHLARWGGLGTHRYQVGFSGDVDALSWTNLAYQPYFSATGSNVGFGFWSHDIEGPGDNHEMYVRWVQWAAYSGVFRSHDRGMSAGSCDTYAGDTCSNVRVWEVPTKFFEANRAAMTARAELVPYLYTATRQAYDTGVSLIRPMYYDFPEDDLAYATDAAGNFSQYMLGDDMMVAPIVAPADNTSMTPKTIFTPVGLWYEATSGMLYNVTQPGSTLTKSFALTETPVFVRGGAVIPRRPLDQEPSTLGVAMRQYTRLAFDVYPGAASGSGTVYEDDAATTAYVTGAFANTKLAYTRSAGAFQATVSTAGTYSELPATRTVIIRIVSSLPPISVVADAAIPFSRFGGPNTWSYDGPSLTTVIELSDVSVAAGVSVKVSTPVYADVGATLSGLKGALSHALLAKQNFDETRVTPGAHDATHGALMVAARLGRHLSFLAGTSAEAFWAEVSAYRSKTLPAAVAEVQAMNPPAGTMVQLFDSSRSDHVLCAVSKCDVDNSYYATVRVEGYQPDSGHPNAVTLYDWWNADVADNLVTTQSSAPSGYAPADFTNGYVLSESAPGTVALELYYSAARNDHMTVATDAGRADAAVGNYTLMNPALGYVFTSPQPSVDADAVGAVQQDRWLYSWTLLHNVYE